LYPKQAQRITQLKYYLLYPRRRRLCQPKSAKIKEKCDSGQQGRHLHPPQQLGCQPQIIVFGSAMLTTKQKILIGSFSRSPNPSSPLSPPHFLPFYVYVFPDPAEKSGAFQLTLRSRDLTLFLELHGPFNVLTESSIPQSYVNSHSHHFKTAPPTADEFNDDYYSFSALRALAISLGRHDLEELCKLKMDDVLTGKYYPALLKNRVVTPEKSPKQSTFQFHVVNINTPVSTSSLSPRSDNHSPTYSRSDRTYSPCYVG
jgi:hypothetical protein